MQTRKKIELELENQKGKPKGGGLRRRDNRRDLVAM